MVGSRHARFFCSEVSRHSGAPKGRTMVRNCEPENPLIRLQRLLLDTNLSNPGLFLRSSGFSMRDATSSVPSRAQSPSGHHYRFRTRRAFDRVSLGKAGDSFALVFVDTTDDVIRHAKIQRSVFVT